MKKIYFIFIIFIAAAVLIIFARAADFLRNGSSFNLSKAVPNSAEFPTKDFNVLSDYREGTGINIKNITRQAGETIIELAFDNHNRDLSVLDISKLSSFSGVKPKQYQIISSEMGGHHIEAEMSFGGELYGELVIGLSDSLAFSFNIR